MLKNPIYGLRVNDARLARVILGVTDPGEECRPPDLTIAPDGEPYIYRWHVIPRNCEANVYLHLQVASDPERPLHDHPWDNMSVILAGGYEELLTEHPGKLPGRRFSRRPGDTIFRKAAEAHRIFLPSANPYSLSLFTTGPKVREWGFWTEDRGWVAHHELIENLPDGRSVFKGAME